MLAFSAVCLAFLPALHHAWTFAASRRTFGVIVALILIVGVAAVLFVNSAVSDPVDFLPIAAVTVGLRLSSPFLLYRQVQARFAATKWWTVLRALVISAFIGFAGILAYHLARIASGSEAVALVVVSEQVAMALGASVLIIRAGLRIRPRETPEVWPIWAAAVLLALAFVVVLPYAVPAFEIVYAASGLIGWSIGVFAAVRDV